MPGQAQTPLKSFGVAGGNLGALACAAIRLQDVQGVGAEEVKDEAPAQDLHVWGGHTSSGTSATWSPHGDRGNDSGPLGMRPIKSPFPTWAT